MHTDRPTPSMIVRALRLPFVGASALPCAAGSLLAGRPHGGRFTLCMTAVVCAHLGANLLNDWADSRSGADWAETRYFGLFGGSKLIQEGLLSERFYLRSGLAFLSASAAALAGLAASMGSAAALAAGAALVLAWGYSCEPLRLSYRRLGESAVFVLFGPAPAMAGWYAQTGVFPALRPFLLSLPFGFLTAAVLLVNEVPDIPGDTTAGKRTLAAAAGPRGAWILCLSAQILAACAVALAAAAGVVRPAGLLAAGALAPGCAAAAIVARHPRDKVRLLAASRLTIAAQTAAGIVLTLAVRP